jgi:hypothetical protein
MVARLTTPLENANDLFVEGRARLSAGDPHTDLIDEGHVPNSLPDPPQEKDPPNGHGHPLLQWLK